MKEIIILLVLIGLCFSSCATPKAGTSAQIQILATSDTHGKFLPYDYTTDKVAMLEISFRAIVPIFS